MSNEKGFGSFSSAFSSGSSASSGGGFAFKPSALASLTTHIDTKVITNQNADATISHTPEVMKFLSSKPDDLKKDGNDKSQANSSGESKSSFVFGKNIDDRVVNIVHSPTHQSESEFNLASPEKNNNQDKSSPISKKSPEEDRKSPDDADKAGDGKSVNIFSAASKGLLKASTSEQHPLGENSPSVEKTVFHTAENTTVFNVNRLQAPVPSLETGEENEDTLFHATCKLHVLDSQKNTWLERGRGLVKINRDRTTQKCRVVMRQQGIFRLLLNSPIFPGMRLKQVSARGIHVTATEVDTGAMRVFLLTSTTPTETAHLLHYLNRIISDLNATEAESKPASSSPHQHSQEEWRAAEGTRQTKHGRDNAVRSSREDVSGEQLQQHQIRTNSGAVRRGSAPNFGQQYSDESDEDDDSGHDRKAKRALTVMTSRHKNEDSSNSRGSIEDDDEEDDDVEEEPEGSEVEEASGGSLDDSLSSNSASGGGGAGDSNKNKKEIVVSAETSNASLDLKRPRLLAGGANAADVVDEEQQDIDDNKATD